jgi:hypothetical protein
MDNIIVFDVPIYSMSKKKYYKKLNIFLCKPGYTKISKSEKIDKMNWKYNQIIGYVEISITTNYVYFNIYFKQKNFSFFNKKHWIKLHDVNNNHYRIKIDYTNNNIKEEILKYLINIENKYISKNYYLNKEN